MTAPAPPAPPAPAPARAEYCRFYWGSHGCALPAGHGGTIHQCGTDDGDGDEYDDGICCCYDVLGHPDRRVQFDYDDPEQGGWGPFTEGWWIER